MKIKKKLIKFYETCILIAKNYKYYLEYFFVTRPKIKKILKLQGFVSIKPTAVSQWKIWYGTLYYKCKLKEYCPEYKGRNAFIKVMGPALKDCYENEVILNEYIKKTSKHINNHTCKMICNLTVDDNYIIAYEYINFEYITGNENFLSEFNSIINEYSRASILHTDFGVVNMGISDNKYYFFDYGTSICPDSKNVRLRNSKSYNHIADITDSAMSLFPSTPPDYYYDDVIHSGIATTIDRNKINFIVGKGNDYYARLGQKIYRFILKDSNLIAVEND